MRRLAPFLFALVLLLPAAAVSADGTYQTPNGQQTFSSMTVALRAAGYGGPWDEGSVVEAYARTTGGPVTPLTAPAEAAQQPGRRTIVVLIGGYDSTLDSANWGQLGAELRNSWGYSSDDLFKFSYAGWHVPAGASSMSIDWYSTPDTCNTIDSEARSLGDMMRFVRDAHWADNVVLVGHSLGGVLGIQALMADPSLTPFVRTAIAVDSPFGGVNAWSGLLFCGSLDELVARRPPAQSELWQAYYAAQLAPSLARGLQLRVVMNPQDDMLGYAYQCLCKLNVNYSLSAPGHSAVFYTQSHVHQIASWIGPQGR